jgi:ubiquinone/menaquinone biosynthesis C-methylase UbiE
MAKKYTVLETWIVNETNPVESTSAEQTYDRMEQQGAGRLPVIDVEQDFHEEFHFDDEARIRDIAAHLSGASQVLDVGVGDGWPLLRIAPLFGSVTGIDASAKRVKTSAANAERLGLSNVSVKFMSATEMDFKDNTFDGAVAATSIEQASDPYLALREIYRVLRPGAKFRVYFEPYERRDKDLTEKLFLTETEDAFGYHYVLQHKQPAWERNYLVKFNVTPEMSEEFRKLGDLISRLGDTPAQNPELGLQFLERNREQIAGSSSYELEHFTSLTMKESLEEVGFVNVRITWWAATLAKTLWPRISDSDLTDSQVRDVLHGLADIATRLEAPAGLGEPVVAMKPN